MNGMFFVTNQSLKLDSDTRSNNIINNPNDLANNFDYIVVKPSIKSSFNSFQEKQIESWRRATASSGNKGSNYSLNEDQNLNPKVESIVSINNISVRS